MCAALEGQEWDVITSDHCMPHFSAPAALALAKELRPDLPFIVVCGETDPRLAVSLIKGGGCDHIEKRELVRIVPTIKRELREVATRRNRQQAKGALEVYGTRDRPDRALTQFRMRSYRH
jgi:two-component system, NarL family, sensor histidine kinase UhpB